MGVAALTVEHAARERGANPNLAAETDVADELRRQPRQPLGQREPERLGERQRLACLPHAGAARLGSGDDYGIVERFSRSNRTMSPE